MPEVALRAEGLEKRFGGLRAVADVSLDVHVGEIHAVIGPNGAGKSTLINLLSGELRASAGAVHLGGRNVSGLAPDRLGLAGLGRSYQKTTIFLPFTAFENVRLAAQARAPGRLSMFRAADRDAAVAERACAALATVGLDGRGESLAGLLSHGEQRQLELAMVLATEPTILVLDEPLAGMGQAEASRMIALIRSLKAGRAILIVEHDMDAVFALADRLTVMADGRVIASGAPEEVRRDPAVRTAYLGEDGPA
jgi:branched-chain amino acid transport system ATP-binding protein